MRALVVAALIATLPAAAATRSASVDGLQGRRCTAYLHFLDGARDLALIAVFDGTGIYSEATPESLEPSVHYLLDHGEVAVLTIDKPGVHPVAGAPDKVDLDTAAFDAHVQGDLSACAAHALAWASSQTAVSREKPFFLRGHSEGAIVAVRTYRDLLAAHSPIAERVKVLFLSGMPLAPFKKTVDDQLARGPRERRRRFERALREKDDAFLREWGGISALYLDDALSQEPLSATLRALAGLGATARFQVLHGLSDENSPVADVQAFETENEKAARAGKPALHWSGRYYLAGHGLNRAAMDDVIMAVESFLAP